MGLAYRDPDNPFAFTVTEIFVPRQEVGSTKADIDDDGMAVLADELLSRENGEEAFEALRFWGHSHVNMGVNPSGTDNETFEQLAGANEFFIRLIVNKSGDLNIAVYLRDEGITLYNVPWATYMPSFDARNAAWDATIKANVREHVYASYTYKGDNYKPRKSHWDKEKKTLVYEDEQTPAKSLSEAQATKEQETRIEAWRKTETARQTDIAAWYEAEYETQRDADSMTDAECNEELSRYYAMHPEEAERDGWPHMFMLNGKEADNAGKPTETCTVVPA